MKSSKAYTVAYREYQYGEEKTISLLATSKYDAYIKVIDMFNPYSAWLVSVTYKNGNYRKFNNIEGDAY